MDIKGSRFDSLSNQISNHNTQSMRNAHNVQGVKKSSSQDIQQNKGKEKSPQEVAKEVKKEIEIKKEKKIETKKVQDNKEKEDIKIKISELVTKLNKEMSPLSKDIKFGYNEDIGGLRVSVVDVKTGEVIRQFPTDEAIELMTKMKELVGLLFDKKG